MCSDMEMFINLIFLTPIISDMLLEDTEGYLEIINLLEDWEKFNEVNDIIKLGDDCINKAIKEVLDNEYFIKRIKEDTKIDITKIQLVHS